MPDTAWVSQMPNLRARAPAAPPVPHPLVRKMDGLSRQLRLREALDCLAELKKQGGTASDLELAYRKAAVLCRSLGDGALALQLVQEQLNAGRFLSFTTMENTLQALAGAGMWRQALTMLRRFEEKTRSPAVALYMDAMMACAVAGERDEEKTRPPALTLYMDATMACAVAGERDQVMKLWEEMRSRGMDMGVVAHNGLFRALAEMGDGKAAERYFREMVDGDGGVYFNFEMVSGGVVPDVLSYAALVAAYGRARDLQRIADLLTEVENVELAAPPGLVPNRVLVYDSAMQALNEAARHLEFGRRDARDEEARQLRTQALQLFRNATSRGLKPTEETYKHALNACRALGDVRSVEQLLRHMQKTQGKELSAGLIAAAIRALRYGGEVGAAARALPQLEKARGAPLSAQAYLALMHSCAKEGAHALLDQLQRTMQQKALLEQLQRTTQQKGVPMTAGHYEMLMRACIRHRDLERAFELHEEMVAAGVQPSSKTYRSLIQVCGSANRPREALRVLHMVRDDPHVQLDANHIVQTLDAIATAGARHAELLAVMRSAAAAGVAPSAHMYERVIRVAASYGALDEAQALLRGCRARGLAPTVSAYESLAWQLRRAGRFEESEALLDESRRYSDKDRTRRLPADLEDVVAEHVLCSRELAYERRQAWVAAVRGAPHRDDDDDAQAASSEQQRGDSQSRQEYRVLGPRGGARGEERARRRRRRDSRSSDDDEDSLSDE
ncbi:hypothetical protein JKP88DRAFT_346629 [Tribonema minus]|uniref:Pentacotripeptide-repeat region of PRORP domain-containing protein n=1 Tax=Tribonema minus TaxID=303371 RepID=A0A835Z2R8_9STRA|nr:hypothetical protein JKP88DRAFT_346629 [Tribonema minus]